MNEQGKKMMNQQQQRMSMSQQNQMLSMSQQPPQILNPQLQQQQQQVENNKFNFNSMYNFIKPPLMTQQLPPQMMNRSYRMWPQPPLPPPPQNPNPNLKQFVTGKQHPKPLGPRNNWKGKKVNKRNEIGTSGGSSIAVGGYKPPTLNDLQQQNRLKARRFFPKKKYYHNNNNRTAPYAPRNTSSYIIRAKKSGGIASLVSPCPVTPSVLPTPMFSPSREVLVDMAKEEWGVDGYGSMNGLIRLRSPGGNEDEEEEEGGSSESDVEEHVEVERRLDHDLSRFEMIYPNYSSGMEYNNVLGNRVDDQDTHIAQLEEENLILKDRLFLMERELGDLRRRLHSLERRGHGYDEMNEEVVENESESESESHGDGHSLEDNNVELEGVGNVRGKEENRIEDDAEFVENEERVGKEGEQVNAGGIDEAVEKESNEVGKEDEEVDGNAMDEVLKKVIVADVGSKSELNDNADVKTGNEVQFTELNKNTENKVQASDNTSVNTENRVQASDNASVNTENRVQASDNASVNTENRVQASDNASVEDVTMEETSRVDSDAISKTKKEDELSGHE